MDQLLGFGEKVRKLGGKYKYLFIIIAVGLLILMFPTGDKSADKAKEDSLQETFDLESFERRIEKILGSGEGVGRVSVALAMKSGMEYVYAQESRENMREQMQSGQMQDINRDSDSKPSILSNGSGGEEAVVVKKLYPEFLGAAIVCDGAENPRVQMYVTQAVSSLTGITSDRITVIKMKN